MRKTKQLVVVVVDFFTLCLYLFSNDNKKGEGAGGKVLEKGIRGERKRFPRSFFYYYYFSHFLVHTNYILFYNPTKQK